MRAYKQLFLISLRSFFAYRFSALLGWAGSAAYLVASLAIWRALLSNGSIAGYDWPSMKAYLLISWATVQLGGPGIEWRMADRILWGDIATDLTKPIDYQAARLAEFMGAMVFELLAIIIALAAVVAFTGGIAPPKQPMLFAASLILVIPLKFMFMYISCMVCFWTHRYMGVSWAKNAIIMLFSGGLIPLSLLPQWLSGPAKVLPFASVTATPAGFYLGQTSPLALAVSAFWVILLWYTARVLWRGALRALTVHGG